MSETPKEIAERLVSTCKSNFIRFPKTWDDNQIRQAIGSTLMLHRKDGKFDEDATIIDLMLKYGQELSESEQKIIDEPHIGKCADDIAIDLTNDDEAPTPALALTTATPSKETKKRTIKKASEGGDEDSAKKLKKVDTFANEGNRPVGTAIREMAEIYFKNKDIRKGGVFSKGAKAIRESEKVIKDKKAAMLLSGVGKGIAGYMEEFLSTGMITKLEELRAGTA